MSDYSSENIIVSKTSHDLNIDSYPEIANRNSLVNNEDFQSTHDIKLRSQNVFANFFLVVVAKQKNKQTSNPASQLTKPAHFPFIYF